MKRLIKGLIIGLAFISAAVHANTGLLFNIAESGNPVSVNIILCLNGIGPISCQNYHVSADTLLIRTTANHLYPVAGIKVLTPGYEPTGCTPYVNGFCLFTVSNLLPATIYLGPSNNNVRTSMVTPIGDGNETISPNIPQTVNNGATQQFTVTANTGFTLSTTVGGTCPPGFFSGNVYTTGAITTSCSVIFSAAQSAFTVGGTISNLTNSGLILQNNGADNLPVAAGATSFQFPTTFTYNSNYQVTILQQPTNQICAVGNNSGTITSNVTNVLISCVSLTTISVTGSPLLLMPTGFTTGSLTVTNTGINSALNVMATLPPGLAANVDQDASDCVLLLPGLTCYLHFTSHNQAYPATAVTVAGSNTNTQNAMLSLAFPYATNGNVNAVAYDAANSLVYIGGTFTLVGPDTGTGVPIDINSGLPVPPFALVAGSSALPLTVGSVLAAVADGQGGWYIGGTFTAVNGVSVNGLAHLLSDGSLDSGWNTNQNGTVNALALNGSTLYVGGSFTLSGGQSRQNIAALDASTGLATSWNPGVSGGVTVVSAIAVSGSTVYLAGTFNTVGAQTRNNIAAVDANTGATTLWNPNANNVVNTMVLDGSRVYAGGFFTTIGGQTRLRIAALDAITGLAILTWNPSANSQVATIAVNGSTVYAGGNFNIIGGQTRNRIAALDATSGNATAWDPGSNGTVVSLVADGSSVYVGGYFSTIGGQPRNFIAAIDAALPGNATGWNPSANNPVTALTLSGSTIYAGGVFTSIGAQTRNRIAALDASIGQLTSWDPNANSAVNTIAVSGSTVYAGGFFTTSGVLTRNRIAAINATTGLATSWDPNANAAVFTLAVVGTTIYAGGDFNNIGGQIRNRIAALDAITGLAIMTWNPNASSRVSVIVPGGAVIYAGGFFTTIGGQTRNALAALDVTTGLATTWNANVDNASIVQALALSGTIIYAGGNFINIGGQARNAIAALDTTTGLATSWNPNANASVSAIAVSNPAVYAGGAFTTIGGQARNRIAALDATTGLATTWSPIVNNTITALALSDSMVYMGGALTLVDNYPSGGIAFVPMQLPATP